MNTSQELFVLAIAILSVFSSVISIIAFLDSTGVLYRIINRKKKTTTDKYIFMRDVRNDLP